MTHVKNWTNEKCLILVFQSQTLCSRVWFWKTKVKQSSVLLFGFGFPKPNLVSLRLVLENRSQTHVCFLLCSLKWCSLIVVSVDGHSAGRYPGGPSL